MDRIEAGELNKASGTGAQAHTNNKSAHRFLIVNGVKLIAKTNKHIVKHCRADPRIML